MIVKALPVGGLVALVVAGMYWARRPDAGAPTAAVPTGPIVPATMPYRGLAVQVATGYYRPLETYEPMLREIADVGANTVLFCVPGHMEHARSQSIYIDMRKTPPPEEFKALIRAGKKLGLRTVLMPIVLLMKPRGNEWRGVIDPPDWDEWWAQYTEFVLFFADIARDGGAEALMVGSELVSTEKYTARWKTLIGQVRERYPQGKLGYSANWDHYRPIDFWDQLDFIGMTSYYTLADERGPSVEEIVSRWEPVRKDILAWQRRISKPILLTEVGWCSQEGAAKAPWNYYQNQVATPAGMEEQRRLYEAFVRAWNDTPELMGVIWWEWTGSAGGAGDFGYTPKNKPAEEVLRRWFAAEPPSTTSAPAGGQEGP